MFYTKAKNGFRYISMALYTVFFLLCLYACVAAATTEGERTLYGFEYMAFGVLWCASVMEISASEFRNTSIIVCAKSTAAVFLFSNILKAVQKMHINPISLELIVLKDILNNSIYYIVFAATISAAAHLFKKAESILIIRKIYKTKSNAAEKLFPLAVISGTNIIIRPAVNSDIPSLAAFFRNSERCEGRDIFYTAQYIERIICSRNEMFEICAIVHRGKTVGCIVADMELSTHMRIYIKPFYTYLITQIFPHLFSCDMFINYYTLFVTVTAGNCLADLFCKKAADKNPFIECEKLQRDKNSDSRRAYTKYHIHNNYRKR